MTLSIIGEEVAAAVKSLKMGKSSGVDKIPAELVKTGGDAIIDTLTSVCNKIFKKVSLSLQICQHYRTISLISHPSSHADGHIKESPTPSGNISKLVSE